MGIKGLAKVIECDYPEAVSSETDLQKFSGKVIAIDALMCLYQSLTSGYVTKVAYDSNSKHLKRIFFLNIYLLNSGLKPVYVFDGEPPRQKAKTLKIRAQLRESAKVRMKEADMAGDLTAAAKHRRQTVKVEKHHIQETKSLLRLLGIPYIQAPGEAEAQCAELEQAGKVYATASDDLDALTFGSRILIRHLTLKFNKTNPIKEVHLEKILRGIGIDFKEFVDLCILLGCYYCSDIKHIGPKRAVKLIQQYRNIETILQNLDTDVYNVPQDWRYNEARYIFSKPLVIKGEEVDFQWGRPDIHNIIKFLCEEKKINELTVNNGLAKLKNF